jgi:hypothetical protein
MEPVCIQSVPQTLRQLAEGRDSTGLVLSEVWTAVLRCPECHKEDVSAGWPRTSRRKHVRHWCETCLVWWSMPVIQRIDGTVTVWPIPVGEGAKTAV